MSDLVGTPEDRFSGIAAQMTSRESMSAGFPTTSNTQKICTIYHVCTEEFLGDVIAKGKTASNLTIIFYLLLLQLVLCRVAAL